MAIDEQELVSAIADNLPNLSDHWLIQLAVAVKCEISQRQEAEKKAKKQEKPAENRVKLARVK